MSNCRSPWSCTGDVEQALETSKHADATAAVDASAPCMRAVCFQQSTRSAVRAPASVHDSGTQQAREIIGRHRRLVAHERHLELEQIISLIIYNELALDHIQWKITTASTWSYARRKQKTSISKWHLQLTVDSMFSWEILVWSLTASQLQWNGVIIAPLNRIFCRRDT